MAHEILLVKLYEMNKEFAKLHSRIELTGTSDLEQIKTEIKVLHKECQENRLILQNQLKFSRAPKVRQISVAYDRIEAIIKEAQKDLFEKSRHNHEIFDALYEAYKWGNRLNEKILRIDDICNGCSEHYHSTLEEERRELKQLLKKVSGKILYL